MPGGNNAVGAANSQDNFTSPVFSDLGIKMNLRRKSRSKLRIFGSFSSKLRLYRSEVDLRSDKSTPVLLAVKHHSQDQHTTLR